MRSDYRAYLKSPLWQLKRQDVLEREKNKQGVQVPMCELCGKRPIKQIHHLSYAHVGAELLEELQGLCPGCHYRITVKEGYIKP